MDRNGKMAHLLGLTGGVILFLISLVGILVGGLLLAPLFFLFSRVAFFIAMPIFLIVCLWKMVSSVKEEVAKGLKIKARTLTKYIIQAVFIGVGIALGAYFGGYVLFIGGAAHFYQNVTAEQVYFWSMLAASVKLALAIPVGILLSMVGFGLATGVEAIFKSDDETRTKTDVGEDNPAEMPSAPLPYEKCYENGRAPRKHDEHGKLKGDGVAMDIDPFDPKPTTEEATEGEAEEGGGEEDEEPTTEEAIEGEDPDEWERLRLDEAREVGSCEKEYYYGGELKVVQFFKGGKPHGPFKCYYRNGQLKDEGRCKDGEIDGVEKEYYVSGQLKKETTYKDGIPIAGTVKEYDKNGQLKSEGVFKDGKKEGLHREYYENGQVKSEGVYKNGEPVEGTVKEYDEDPIEYDEDGSIL